MEDLKESVEITLKEKQFTLKFPNIGDYIKIEANKQEYADGNYAMLAWSNIASMNRALDIVDAVSYFSVLVGMDFFKIYGTQNTEGILKQFNHTSKDGVELLEAYKVFSEFYNTIDKRVDRPTEDDKDSETKDSDKVDEPANAE